MVKHRPLLYAYLSLCRFLSAPIIRLFLRLYAYLSLIMPLSAPIIRVFPLLYAYLSLIMHLLAPIIRLFFRYYTLIFPSLYPDLLLLYAYFSAIICLSLPYYALFCSYYTLIFVRYHTLMGHVWGSKLTTRGKSGRVLRQTTTGSVQNYAIKGPQRSV